MRAFAMKRGYARCDDGAPENGWEKVALYVLPSDKPKHMARQLENGGWTSKLGQGHDIVHHALDGLNSVKYGTARYFMRRRRDGGHDRT